MGLGYVLNCVLRMFEIFFRGREPEVVVVAVENEKLRFISPMEK